MTQEGTLEKVSGSVNDVTTMWISDQGREDIPVEHIGMIGYRGTVPTVNTDEAGYGIDDGQAFMVEMGPGSEPLRTHFHVVDQFQIVVHGSGTVGRHRVARGSVHYADRYTPYGPLTAGAAGLSYVTLRAVSDTGAYYMPDRRSDLGAGLAARADGVPDRRNLTFDLAVEPAATAQLRRDADGLRIEVATAAAGESAAFDPTGGAGAFAVVLDGAIVHGDAELAAGALRWAPPDAATPFTFTASDAGPVRVAMLQFPADQGAP